MTILQLRHAVSTPPILGSELNESNIISEEEISRRCSSLIRKSESTWEWHMGIDHSYSEFAHFSAQEFLENKASLARAQTRPSLESYHIDQHTSNLLLGSQYLRYLQVRNFDRVQTPSETFGKATLYSRRPFMDDLSALDSRFRTAKPIDLAKGSKISNHPLSLGGLSVFSMAYVVLSGFKDLTPIHKLLASGAVPQAPELTIFKGCLQAFGGTATHNPSTTDEYMEASLKLLQYLRTSLIAELRVPESPVGEATRIQPNWRSQMVSVLWNLALSREFSYTKDAAIIGHKLFMSLAALVERLCVAIQRDDAEAVDVGGLTYTHAWEQNSG
ncbi:hypothetical protein B0H67DRAFT_642426 [Lasiosphaeris hirsuta]|uniref:Uncharacterized protein n=1 Tax=Lasiosphaeris hirsuta TaxID=260670 RepID=A0AA40B259_9PEZI|nr:hypothetical protein B0H67DRAFT_642426 [Lasiosphaeris hirsuta]